MDLSMQGVWQPLDGILPLGNVHERHTGDLAQPSSKSSIAGRHNVDTMRGDSVGDAVVSVRAFVVARQAFK